MAQEHPTEQQMQIDDSLFLLKSNEVQARLFGAQFHLLAAASGWWTNLKTGEPLERNKGELLCLIHSEISEAMEGERKNLVDDHLAHRPMAEVELADAVIRIFDYAGKFGYDIVGAMIEKASYNAKRADHKPENRVLEGGKQF